MLGKGQDRNSGTGKVGQEQWDRNSGSGTVGQEQWDRNSGTGTEGKGLERLGRVRYN